VAYLYQSAANLLRNLPVREITGEPQHGNRIHEADGNVPVRFFAHEHVVGQQHDDARIGGPRPVRERWLASAEDAIGPPVHVRFFRRRFLYVGVGQHAKALRLQGFDRVCDGLVETVDRLRHERIRRRQIRAIRHNPKALMTIANKRRGRDITTMAMGSNKA